MNENQIGFRKGRHTTDHIFFLKSIIDKVVKKGQYLYICFVDFSKAYDKVWRSALFFKLECLGINGPILDMIKDMYNSVNYSLKLPQGVTDPIPSEVGLKQGCIMSPVLFNLYINDMPQCFDQKISDPIQIGEKFINVIMYADDLVLLSRSKEGLQSCLNQLESYCCKWKLEVNISKTQVMIFNKGGKVIKNHSFTYGKSELSLVQKYKYLGFYLSASGVFTNGIELLCKKAQKVVFMIKSRFSSYRSNSSLLLRLFDMCVKPILLYAAELWSVFHLNVDNLVTDKGHVNLVSKIREIPTRKNP